MDHATLESLNHLFAPGWTIGAVVRFHTAHKLLLIAHSPEAYRRLGRLVAAAATLPAVELERRYTTTFVLLSPCRRLGAGTSTSCST
jgi:uncharacterized protein YbgA (DUF1722 family)